ncbi:MAG: sugar transferase [Clostridia bacterium]|nr:sugar transferase [Clostridia bacterium]
MYSRLIKRILDFILSLSAIILLFPLMVCLTLIGAIVMKGNPFFSQERPGRYEKLFHILKFRTMNCKKDKNGELLSDEQRINRYGSFLRKTSLDELPELFNILAGQMSFVGPRPLLTKYLPFYTEEERLRHSVRPGLTGYAQVHGRNAVSWEKRFELDLWYVKHISLLTDLKVILQTVKMVVCREGVLLNSLEDLDEYRKQNRDTGD